MAVLDTLRDLGRQVIAATLQSGASLPNGASFGGLRGGYARLTATQLTLRGFAFVAGVQLTGSFRVAKGELQPSTIQIGGRSAAVGSIRYGTGAKRVSGSLGGRRFNLSLARVRIAGAAGGEWPAQAPVLSGFGH